MSELPLSKGELTPKIEENPSLSQNNYSSTAVYIDEGNQQGYNNSQGYTNPYGYYNPQSYDSPQTYSNPQVSNIPQNYNRSQEYQHSTDSQDPQLQRFKNSFWKRAGQAQQTIGSWAQMDSWRESGQQTQTEADRAIQEAEGRIQNGQASWIHGEYERWMGKFSYAVGHVVGDPEMQAKASLRSREGEDEINRVLK